jgi:lipopolysaccharide export system permease protein
MSCYLNLSRRHELVVARAAGISAWQFVAPAVIVALLIGAATTMLYNPVSAALAERSKRLESELFGDNQSALQQAGGGFWVRQRTLEGEQAIINAQTSREQGARLDVVSIFTYDAAGHFRERIEAKSARLEAGHWRLDQARVYSPTAPPRDLETYLINTTLTSEQVRESFATPETVSFWQLPLYIDRADQAGLGAAGYRLQYQLLLARPFLLTAMVLLAASVSLRFFRFGGVPKMVLSGVSAGFLLYVLSKVTEDVSKAELMHPAAAAWVPVLFGAVTGIVVLLYQEDG